MGEIIDLKALKETCDAEGALVINSNGEILESINIHYEDNIAAMTGVITKMAEDLSDDLEIKPMKQLMIRSKNGIFIINKFNDNFIIGLFSKDITKAGVIMLSLNNLKIKS